MIMTLDTHL